MFYTCHTTAYGNTHEITAAVERTSTYAHNTIWYCYARKVSTPRKRRTIAYARYAIRYRNIARNSFRNMDDLGFLLVI